MLETTIIAKTPSVSRDLGVMNPLRTQKSCMPWGIRFCGRASPPLQYQGLLSIVSAMLPTSS